MVNKLKIFKRTIIFTLTSFSIFTFYVFFKLSGNRKSVESRSRPYNGFLVAKLPLRLFSRYFGLISEKKLPGFVKKPLFIAYSYIFKIDLSETNPISTFDSFSDFFTRSIDIKRFRPICLESDIISPVDARITSLGKIIDQNSSVTVKGTKLPMDKFTAIESPLAGKNLHFIAFYLSPGDYHRFHSPADWSVARLRHFVGELLPVSRAFTRFFPSIFSINERIVLEGSWKHGYISFTPIGAFNVGSICLSPLIEPWLRTNVSNSQQSSVVDFEREEGTRVLLRRQEEIGFFKIGSSVMLIFEVPEGRGFLFRVKEGDKVKVGQGVGVVY